MKNKIHYNKYKIFSHLNENEINLFVDKIKIKNFRKNQIVFSEGDIGESIIFLLTGKISITKALTLPTNKNKNSDIVEKEFGRFSEEQYISLGENSLFNVDKQRTATIKTLSDCKFGFLDNSILTKICENNYEVGYKMLKNLNEIITNNLIKTNRQVLKLTTAFSLLMN